METLPVCSFIFIFIICLVPAVTSGTPTTVSGYRGGSVEIKCNYTSGYGANRKYLCRGTCSTFLRHTRNIPVESGFNSTDNKFFLYDNKAAAVFIVTIADLRAEDGGTYWCGVEHLFKDDYTEILLLVTDCLVSTATPTSIPSSPSTHEESTPSSTAFTLAEQNQPEVPPVKGVALYAFIGAGFTLLAAATIAVLYCKIKFKGPKLPGQTSSEVNGDQQNNCSLRSSSIYENIDHTINPSPAVCHTQSPQRNPPRSLLWTSNPKGNKLNTVCQTLNRPNTQSESIYVTMNGQANQSKAVGQMTKSETDQFDSVEQAMKHKKTPQLDPVYETMNFRTKPPH